MIFQCGAPQTSQWGIPVLVGAALVAGLAAMACGQQPPVAVPYSPSGGAPAPYAGQGLTNIPGAGSAFMAIQDDAAMTFTGPVSPQGQLIPSRRSGMQLTVVVGSAGQYGYQPLAVTASLAAPAGADRRVRFQFSVGGWGRENARMTVTESFTLERGETSATASLFVPKYEEWDMCNWQVWVDGVLDEDLSQENVQHGGSPGVCVLMVSELRSTWNYPASLQAMGGSGAFAVLRSRPADLPLDWKRYTTIDLVVIDAQEFADLAGRFPDQCTSLVRWLRAGGNLWMTNVGASWEALPAVEAALALPAADGNASEDVEADAAIVARGWRFAELNELALQPIEGALALSGFLIEEAEQPEEPPSGAARSRRPTLVVETSKPWFAVRGHGLGVVAAFRRDLDDAPGGAVGGQAPAGAALEAILSGAQAAYGIPDGALDPALASQAPAATAISRSLLLPRLSWTARHGNQPDEANLEFNNWLIPGVGVAPVGQFQFLISLFVLGIGPLTYWWLKRRKKLPMLIAIVPTAAAAVTLILLAVGVFADGLGVRVRARSLTLLDQTQGEAVAWSRLSYYAGISPREGLRLPHDTVVYPIASTWGQRRNWRGAATRRSLQWGEAQELTAGWLASRTPTQYLAITARPSRRRLEMRNVAGGLRIVNRLGVAVTHLAVQDHDGKFYWCENLAPDATFVAKAVKHNDATGKLRVLFSDNFPEFPPGGEPVGYGGGYGGYYGPQASHNLMEAHLEAVNSPVIDGWIDGSYIAVTDRGVDLPLGLDHVEEEASFHVIQGKW